MTSGALLPQVHPQQEEAVPVRGLRQGFLPGADAGDTPQSARAAESVPHHSASGGASAGARRRS